MSETGRGLFQNKFEKLVHLVGFIKRMCVSTLTIPLHILSNSLFSRLTLIVYEVILTTLADSGTYP
jgi:hypothetical protein